ncbi:MAG: U-box domain-containing protein [Candidatus Berkiella sp.]
MFFKILKGIGFGIWTALAGLYLLMMVFEPYMMAFFSIQMTTMYTPFFLGVFVAINFSVGFLVQFMEEKPSEPPRPIPLQTLYNMRPLFGAVEVQRQLQSQARANHLSTFANNRYAHYTPALLNYRQDIQSNVSNQPVENANEIRLKKIGFNLDNIPEEFIDPITMEVMNKPILAYTKFKNSSGEEQLTRHIYDEQTYKKFNGKCPENRLLFIESKVDDELKAKIEKFVQEQENLASVNANIKQPGPALTA